MKPEGAKRTALPNLRASTSPYIDGPIDAGCECAVTELASAASAIGGRSLRLTELPAETPGHPEVRPTTRRGAPRAIGCTAPGGPDPRTGPPESRRESAGTARLLTLREVTQQLGVSYRTGLDLVATGEIPVVRIPSPRGNPGQSMRRILIDPADVQRLIAKWKDRSA